MQISVGSRFKHAWNAFLNNSRDPLPYNERGNSSGSKPDRVRLRYSNERSIVTSVLNQLAVDVASLSFRHVKLDQNERYLETIHSGLNECLTLDANLDQTGSAFIQDVVLSMFDEGCVAIVPVDTTFNPLISGSYDIKSLRTGKITQWFPSSVECDVYNEKTGKRERLILPKTQVAILENPLYAVMNEHNSTLKRLIRKLNILDGVDEQSGSGKLDLIIQLPYALKTELKREQANKRRDDLQDQMKDSKYGIGYIDATEKITQLNRPVENNLMNQITYLTSMLYSQLGMTEAVFNGTADEQTMLNYYNKGVTPVACTITDGMKRRFLTKTARTQYQSIMFFRDPFKLVPVTDLAEIADKMTRNEILSSNEIRSTMGYKPSSDPKADQLRNSNLNDPNAVAGNNQNGGEQEAIMSDMLDGLEADIDRILGSSS